MLLTMGDDKFFGTNDISTSSRNPRSLDGVKSLSRRLLIIASTLFQREGQADRYKGKGEIYWGVYARKSFSVPRCDYSREYVMFDSFLSIK